MTATNALTEPLLEFNDQDPARLSDLPAQHPLVAAVRAIAATVLPQDVATTVTQAATLANQTLEAAAQQASTAVTLNQVASALLQSAQGLFGPKIAYSFTAAAGQTIWNAPAGVTWLPGAIDVFVNGIRWNRTESWDDSTAKSVSFVNALPMGYAVTILIGTSVVYPVVGISNVQLALATPGNGADMVGFTGANGVATTVSALASSAGNKGANLIAYGASTLAQVIDPDLQSDAATLTGAEYAVVKQAGGFVRTTLAKVVALAQAPFVNANAADAGALTGAEVLPASRGTGLLQTTLTKIAQFVIQTYQGFTQSGTGGIAQPIAAMLSKTLYVSDFDTPDHAATAGLNKRLVVPFGTTVYVPVPSLCSTIQAAITAIASWDVYGSVIIQVADGTYQLTSGINLNHPFGQNVQLVGNLTNPDNCVLLGTNPPTFNGISCSNGNRFGYLDGFRIDLAAKAVLANNYSGLIAYNGAYINCGPHMKVNNWYYGINASYGSVINCPSAIVSYAGDVGIWAFCGSQITAMNAQSNYCSDTVNGWGFGFQGEYGSQVNCQGASATGNNIAGFAALSSSEVRALSTTSNANVGSGYLTRQSGTIEAYSSSSTNNTRYGIEIQDGSGSVLGLTTNTGNALGTINPLAVLDTTTGAARLSSSKGQLRLDVADTSSVYFNNSNGLQAEIRDGGTGTKNRPVLRGGGVSNGYQAQLMADGSDTDIPIRYDTKGVGAHYFNTGNGPQFQIYDTPSAVNRFAATGSAAGVAPRLQAIGTDTNIHLRYTPKGTGTHLFDGLQNFASDSAAATGGIPVGGIYRNGSVMQIRVS